MIRIQNLYLSFKNKMVLENITLQINKGSITAIYGESGIGKTTIAKVLTGIVKPDSGDVFYQEQSLWNNGKYDRSLGISIQMVYQQPEASLDPSYRIGKLLDEILAIRKIPKEVRTKRIREIIASLGLREEILGHYPYQISGGEAQRISLARCLLLEPKVLILDEATSMLDSETQAFLLNWLKKNYLKEDTTIIFISHDLELVEFYSDKIYRFKNGELKKYEKKS